jgi:hypothetical protein
VNLKHLSDQNLHLTLVDLARRERALLAQILWHLKEVDRRKLYCDHKCSSLFDYCVKGLGYSEGQASRRVSAARLLKELPEIVENISAGELNLTHLNQAKNFFHEQGITDKSKKREVLSKLKGKTTRESEGLLWSMKNPETPRKMNLWINESTYDELKKVKDLKAHKYQDMDSLLLGLAKEVTSIWSPTTLRAPRPSNPASRYVPNPIKTSIWTRDRGKCRNCGSTRALEYDHILPYSRGGKTTLENLQLLCRNCNQRKAASSAWPNSTGTTGDSDAPLRGKGKAVRK